MSFDLTKPLPVPTPKKRGSLGVRLGVVAVIVLATIGLAKAWDSGSRPSRLWEGRPVSLATIDRACLQGLPYELVGTRRRFDLAAVRAWYAARGKAATTVAQRDPAVDAIARSAGLRVVR